MGPMPLNVVSVSPLELHVGINFIETVLHFEVAVHEPVRKEVVVEHVAEFMESIGEKELPS